MDTINPTIQVRYPAAAVIAGTRPAYFETGLQALNGISAQDYNSIFKGQVMNAIDTVRFDRLRIAGGAALPTTPIQLFGVKLGGAGATAQGTAITKLLDDTNMRQNNEMEYENYLIVESFQCECIVTNQLATTDSNNEVSVPTAASSSATTAAAAINLRTLVSQSWLEWKVGERVVLEGRPIDFPAGCKLSGYGGGAEEGLVQNGDGLARQLRNIVVLRPGEQFGVTITFPTAWTPDQDMDLYVKLVGVRLRPVG